MRNRVLILSLAVGSLLGGNLQAQQSYNVNYFGGGIATLASGSDNPVGYSVMPGNSFFWSITAQNSAYWSVFDGGDFFPFMAFGVNEAGIRTGNYQLSLFRNGMDVFSQAINGAENNYIHLGTNTVSLVTGFTFDRMELNYQLLSATDTLGANIGSTITGLLPVFGAPEINQYYPGIAYMSASTTVPEPTTTAMLVIGLVGLGITARRKALATKLSA